METATATATKHLPTPPPLSLYTAHAAAICNAVEHLHCHFESFDYLLPEDARDGVLEEHVSQKFIELLELLREVMLRTTQAYVPGMSDEIYRQRLAEMLPCVEHMPLKSLAAITERIRNEREDRAMECAAA